MTICALSTGIGASGVAIIRISGPESISIVDNIFDGIEKIKLADLEENKVQLGYIMDNKRTIDKVLVTVFRNPKSYTGEDLVEISCHGSIFIQESIIQLLLNFDCRVAKPGEFTMRSFLNGKMDLSQAESVADLISSNSEASHKLAMNQMRGGFKNDINDLRAKLVNFASLIELELDFSQEDVEFANLKELNKLLNEISSSLKKLIDSFKTGNVIKNGIPIAIVGEPNTGKSTLLNSLLNEDRAIVSSIAGTTRDTIEDQINLNGVNCRFIDTAGIRSTDDEIESIGIERTFKKMAETEVIVFMIDYSDLDEFNPIKISAKNKQNIESLTNEIKIYINNLTSQIDNSTITNSRHYDLLNKTHDEIHNVKISISKNISSDLLAIDIKQAIYFLGELTGEISNNEVLGNIFSKFCIGK